MYTYLKREDAVKLDKLKLCYVDSIAQTYYDYTPEAKAYRETEEWKEQDRLREEKFQREKVMSSDDPEFSLWANPVLRKGADCQEYPNPEYIPGKQEYYAYFTPIPLEKQWGDDWDDAPYEYNAGSPYDDYKDESGNWTEVEMIVVPFYVYHDEWEVRFPRDWGGCNSPFAVEDINGGAVAWIYDHRSKTGINAGCSPAEFFEKLDKISEQYKEDEG
jgi:hypothetical protein